MSALGHKRTFAVQNVMSALHPKADMCSAQAHVCIGQRQTSHAAKSTNAALLRPIATIKSSGRPGPIA